MPYTPPVDWEDTPSTDTPLNDTNITAMETALATWASSAEFRVNGTPVASGTSINPPDGYLVHTISGTADIQTITAESAGKVIVLLFSGNAATNGLVNTTGNLELESSMLYMAGDSITLLSNGTDWIELARKSATDADAFSDLGVAVGGKVETVALSASGMGYVNHGATAGVARPTGYAGITWVGSVTPTNAVDGDVWVDTA